jgi:TRAP-type C4-dicarboxylate transport system permease small subunit
MGSIVYSVSRWLAWLGAFVLAVLAVLSVLSIAGRALTFAGLGPVPGDFELVEAGTALAVFSFLPWCHLKRGHAVVDMLWNAYPPRLQAALAAFADALWLLIWVLLVWRMGVAMLEYRANGETTFILRFPIWWGYAASMVPAVFGCVVAAWRLAETAGLVAAAEGFATAEGGH